LVTSLLKDRGRRSAPGKLAEQGEIEPGEISAGTAWGLRGRATVPASRGSENGIIAFAQRANFMAPFSIRR